MSKIAFVFPGQGTQYIGMGKDFYDKDDLIKEIYRTSSEVSGLDIEKICFEENDQINITEYTQIALLTTQIAILEAVKKLGIKADVTAGLSLGEYAAIYASEVIGLKDILHLIRQRGIYMQNAYPEGGAMMAILGLDSDVIKKVIGKVEGIVGIANDNCPGQVVISGEKEAVLAAGNLLSEAGAKRCILLNVSGPFHSELLKGAGELLHKEMENISISNPVIPYICNVEAALIDKKDRIKELLEKQVYSSVRFRESIEHMLDMGVTTFVEIGPGKTLAGFIKKMNRDVNVIGIEKLEDLEKLSGICQGEY